MGGANWSNLAVGTMDILYSVFFINDNKGYVVGEGRVFYTTDGGISWDEDSIGTNNLLRSIFFSDSTTGYAVGVTGTILNKGKDVGVSVEEHKSSIEDFRLSPNPAIDKITIRTNLKGNEEINIIIFDMWGKQVISEKFYSHTISEFDVSKLAKGIYLVKIQTKVSIEVKRLIIN